MMPWKSRLFAVLLSLPLLAAGCADESVEDASCEDGNCDLLGEHGDRCWNLNVECAGELVCRPTSASEEDQFCLEPSEGDDYCDDDDDCAGQLICEGETDFNPGKCRGGLAQDDRCYNFNFECSAGLTCQPVNQSEDDQFCLAPTGIGGLCDDDDDCEGELLCLEETQYRAGTCRSL